MLRGARVLAFRAVGNMPRWMRRLLIHSVAPSFTVGAMCMITRPDGARLFVRHSYREGWGVPGGLLKRGEEAADGARRECMEEVGLAIVLDHPPTVVVDAAARRVDVIFPARPTDGVSTDVKACSAEVLEARWFLPGELPSLQHETANALRLVARGRERAVTEGLAGVVLAAGAGTRLRPLTLVRPKALCPIDNLPLVDLALGQLRPVTPSIAVNVHHGRALLESYLADRAVHLSVEEPEALGTAGALGRLRKWISGRDVLVANADTWREHGLGALTDGWDGSRVRLLVTEDPAHGDFGRWRYTGAALMPWAEVRDLAPEPAGLYEVSWAPLEEEGRLDLVTLDGRFIDCGTPADYLAANLAASGGRSVIGEGAMVAGELARSVVWPGGVVGRDEHLVDAIRVWDWMTVPG